MGRVGRRRSKIQQNSMVLIWRVRRAVKRKTALVYTAAVQTGKRYIHNSIQLDIISFLV